MQSSTVGTASSQARRDRAWLVMADRHWSAAPITANEFAAHVVGCALLHDIAAEHVEIFDAVA